MARPERFELPTLWFEAARMTVEVVSPSLTSCVCYVDFAMR